MKPQKELTALTTTYKLKAALAILSIIVFFALFSAMVAGLAYLVYYSVMYDIGFINKFTILGKVGAIAGSAMLLFFSLKFVFKLKNHKPENRLKVTKETHPMLWEFVYEICSKTGAAKPKNIYVDPDVNAYVAYTNTWLSIFLPVKKELTIGMALVDCLNMSEFRAVVAHEFGHFAQRSMKIGSYIMSANTIIHDMIFTRDRWDRVLEQWRSADLRLSFAAWIITPIIWLIRQMLNLFYMFLNVMYSSLSREMEFNADKVAVSVSGSDAILSALWKLDNGSEKWNSTLTNAYLAAQKNIYTDDLYYHNGIALKKAQAKIIQTLKDMEQDPRGGLLYFKTSENSKTNMYASHPPNDKRQDNAKVPYVEGTEDRRSPWELFGEKNKLRTEMTKLVYKKYLDKDNVASPSKESFQKFIEDETSAGDLEEAYENTFSGRLFSIPDKLKMLEIKGGENYLGTIEKLKSDLSELMQPIKEINALMTKAQQIGQGVIKDKFLMYDGKKYTRKNLQEGYEKMTANHDKLLGEFTDWDHRFCLLHLSLCQTNDERTQLRNRYEQHRVITRIFEQVLSTQRKIYKDLHAVQANQENSQNIN
ncbi:MAG: M48 family metallopeptidase [Fluviicola sp.]